MSTITTDTIKRYVRAANYIAAAQIYLRGNVLLKEQLRHDDIKPRLLGHWGTCPGINFLYANLNTLINETGAEMMFVLGPGHGFPALQANLFMEGSLGAVDGHVTMNENGLKWICQNFSWPFGYPSHSNPEAPGVILEGGELGYALGVAYGSILDNPDLITAVLIGDGEAETGPTATAWHLNKLVNPATNGAVLPVLHLNGYKISGPTIYGRMTDAELTSLFTGYGYEPIIVDKEACEKQNIDVYEKMRHELRYAYKRIRDIQEASRSGETIDMRMPMIIMRTPKGWTGIPELDGLKLEGNYASHQVIAGNARDDDNERIALDTWLRSYNFSELFTVDGGLVSDLHEMIPEERKRMGATKHAHGGLAAQGGVYEPLKLPPASQYAEDATVPGTIGSSSMRRAGEYLTEVFRLNRATNNFRLFSPDETYSNKLDAVFRETARAWVREQKPWDKDMRKDGRVMEMLSEHTLQALMMGYVLTGRHGVFASYEAFIQIVASMADQYAKFLKVARTVSFRGPIGSLNYILTSSGWRQDHNGFSHQNPGFIDDMLKRQGCFVNVYFPADGNMTLAVLKRMLGSEREINILSAGKTLEPRWQTPDQAEKQLERGLATWEFASDDRPDVVIAAAGDYLTKEALAAISIVKAEAPQVRIRFVNIVTLNALGLGSEQCQMSTFDFADFFTHDKPVIFNFHGYPQTLKQMLFDYAHDGTKRRFIVHGYEENGSTTTPHDMQVRNRTDRWHLAMDVFTSMLGEGVLGRERVDILLAKYNAKLKEHSDYIREHGLDLPEIEEWAWKRDW